MIPYQSFISWEIGPVTIQSWGLMVAIAFLVGTTLAAREAKRRKLNPETVYDLLVWVIIGAFLVSRASYVISYWSEFAENPIEILYIWKGGLTFLGGLIGGLLVGLIYVKIKRIDFLKYADIVAIYLPLGHAIGRIGCVLGDGGHLGKATDLWFGVVLEGETQARHLVALYEAIWLLVVFGAMIYLKRREEKRENMRDGFLLCSYLFMYGFFRFFEDFLRVDPTYFLLTASQWVSIGLMAAAAVYLLKKKK